ncbi:hypothetical protein [Bradyrhizobium sp. URHD0069]|nr:hypothetical protein [Bradyrhizobium sp. URHD0069]
MRIPGFILSDTVHKWRCAMWRMSSAQALIFIAAVAIAVALLLA